MTKAFKDKPCGICETGPNSGNGTRRILDNLAWILQAGDFSYREFVSARYAQNTKRAAGEFLKVLHERDWIRKAYEPVGASNMHDFTLWCVNREHPDISMMVSIARQAKTHSMGHW